MTDHYKTLDVGSDASEKEIKQAYRAKSREHHPDKGGNKDIFATLSKAYNLLKDPFRRKLYDDTGIEANDTEIEQLAGAMIVKVFNSMIGQAEYEELIYLDIVKEIKNSIIIGIRDLTAKKQEAENDMKSIEDILSRLSHKDGRNAIQLVLKDKARYKEKVIAKHNQNHATAKVALKMLEKYSFEPKANQATTGTSFFSYTQ